MSAFSEWWEREGKFYDPDTEDVSWHDKRAGLAEKAFLVATVQSGNYTANDETAPTEVVFANGRRVWINQQGHLSVGRSDA